MHHLVVQPYAHLFIPVAVIARSASIHFIDLTAASAVARLLFLLVKHENGAARLRQIISR